jgi:hypothetical protein
MNEGNLSYFQMKELSNNILLTARNNIANQLGQNTGRGGINRSSMKKMRTYSPISK